MSVNVVDNNVTVTAVQEVEVVNEVVTNTVVNEYPNTISVKSNEFAVVGDGLFATTKEEVPGWMKELVGDLARNATIGAYNAMTGFNYNLYNAMIALQVAENKYQQAINTRITDQEAFVQAVETLNSTVQNSEAEIVEIKQTYATKDFATTTAAQTLEASLNGGAIKSSLGQLASTMTNQYGTMAQRVDVLESTFEDLELGVEGYANATNTLETYVGLTEGVPDGTGLIAKVEILERQNDGVIETTTGTYDVILRAAEPDFSELVTTAEPYASWLAAEISGGIDVRLSHIGDVYIKYQDTTSGAKEYVGSYKFIRTVVDTTTPHSTDSAGFTWAVIQDQAAEMAYTAALNAHDLADSKRRVFVSTPVGPYDVGDLWVRVVGGSNQVWRANIASAVYDIAHWQVASTDDTAVNNFVDNVYTPVVTSLQSQVDGKIESWYTVSTADPKIAWTTVEERNKHDGDLWYQIDTKNSHYYSSSTNSWNVLEDSTAIAALEAAGTAQATADGVVVSYYAVEQSTAPATSKLWLDDTKLLQKFTTVWEVVPVKVGDTLTTFVTATSDTKVYVFNGTSWVTETGAGMVASSKAVTDLSLSLSNLNNSIYGASGLEQTLRGEIVNGVATAESKFAYNSTITVNNVPYNTGFGLSNSAGTGIGSEFWINADKLKFTNTLGQYTATPFSIDASGTQPQVTFNGKVTFGSGQTGTIDEAIAASIESVVVGDKNINITDNLIPTTSLIADVNNAGYQFVGDPAKSLVAGIDTFAEVQIELDDGTDPTKEIDTAEVDEVYSPFVDEVTMPYYYRFGIKGVTSLTNKFHVVMINDSDELNPVITYGNVTVNLEPGKSMDTNNWYIVDGIINPVGAGAGTSGRILTPALEKVATINNFNIVAGTTKVLLGWVGSCTISRMKLAKITADTFTGTVATVDYVEGKGYVESTDIYAAGTTEIDGGKIKTGTITALGPVTAGSFNLGNGKFVVDENGNTTIKSSTSGARLEITGDVIKVYDQNNVLRVKLGNLLA